MWKDYSVSYIKKNKAAGISIMVAAFIAALFISMIYTLSYNIWTDETRRLIDKEGDWQARFVMQMSEAQMQTVQNYANVKTVRISENGTDIYFEELSTIYTDMHAISELLQIDKDQIEYHSSLLARQFVLSPEEKQNPSLLLGFYVSVIILVCFSLILVIKSAFQFSMNARMHQLGILQSIGATPKQIRLVLLQEALALSAAPILCGVIAGIGLCLCFLKYANTITAQLQLTGAVFSYHYLLFAAATVCSFLTIFLSAWLPARRLSKISPLQAIKGEYEAPAEKVKKFRLASALFGVPGELSRKALYTRRKAYRTSAICLTVSFLVLTVFLDFMTLSEISTGHTYFEKYKNTWDVMIEIQNPDGKDTGLLDRLRDIDGVDTVTAYQKNTAYTAVAEAHMSDKVTGRGGYGALNRSSVRLQNGTYLVEVPIIILDEESYSEYRDSVADGNTGKAAASAIVVNTIWDSLSSSFRHPSYLPFLNPAKVQTLPIYGDRLAADLAGEITIAYAEKAPDLREGYSDYSLVQIMPQSAYEPLSQKLPVTDTLYINVRAASDELIGSIENQCRLILNSGYSYTIENRPQKEKTSAQIYDGYKKFMSAQCGLLACIGIANVFANTLGYVYQRKREFARYQSIGLTPGDISKMFCAEAFTVGVKPILISIPLRIAFVLFAVHASKLEMSEYIARMPNGPMLVFAFLILTPVFISYSIGNRQIKKYNIADALTDDTLY